MTGSPQPLPLRGYVIMSACIIAAGLGLRVEALSTGFMVDDYPQIAMRDGYYPVARPALDLLSFSHGASAENAALRSAGVFPWWSHPQLRIAMLRPLSSALLWVDRALFGTDAFAYHLHSALWWVAMTASLAAVLRRSLPSWAAPLGLLLFVADEAHGSLLGWIAMRNATVASTFALLGLWAQLRSRDDGVRWGRPLALASYALALLAGEYALAFLGYAVLLELCSASALSTRMRRLLGPTLLLVAYLSLRRAGDFGSSHSAIYLEPSSSPGAFARVAIPRFLVLAGDLVAAIPASAWTWGMRWPLEWLPSGLLQQSGLSEFALGRELLQWLGFTALMFGVFIGQRCLRAARASDGDGADLRWLVFGTPLAVLPVLCSFPENRLLVPAQVGWAAVLACFFYRCVTAARSRAGRNVSFSVVGAGALVLYHLIVPAAQAPGDARDTSRNARAMRAAILSPDLDAPFTRARRVFLLGAADPTTTIYLPLVRKLHRRPAPAACLLLSSSAAPQVLQRVSLTAFTLARTFPSYTAADTYAAFFSDQPLHVGDTFAIDGMRVRVERVQDGRPLRTRYELDEPLDAVSSLFLQQTATGLLPLALPAVGQALFLLPPVPASPK